MPTPRKTTKPADTEVLPAEGSAEWRMAVARRELAAVDAAPELTDDEEAEQSIGDRLRRAFEGTPGDRARVSLYRRPRAGMGDRKSQWCQDYHPEDFIAGGNSMIRDQWGAGQYEYRAYGSAGLLTHGLIDIAEAPATAAAAAPAQANSELSQLIGLLVQGQQELARGLQALASAPPPATPTMKDLLEQMALMKNIMGPVATPAAADPLALMKQTRDLMLMMKEVAAETAPKETDADANPMSALIGLAGPLIEMVKNGQQRGTGAGAQLQPLALPPSMAPTEPSAPVADGAPAGPNPLQQMVLDGIVTRLCQMAEAGASWSEGAEFLLNSEAGEEVAQLLDLPNWFEIVSSLAPKLVPHKEWLESVSVKVKEIIAAESQQ